MNPLLHATGGARFLTIDGLRGVAAMMVVIYHFAHEAGLAHGREMTTPWNWLANGVEIFFVLSGFVIAHSVRTAWFSGSFFGRFAFRRLIRLDPTVLGGRSCSKSPLLWVSLQFISGINATLPSWSQFLTHFVYLQGLTGHAQMLPVFWSLCLEFQFYIVLVGGMTLMTAITGRNDRLTRIGIIWCGTGLFVWSVLVHVHFLPDPWPGLFVERWYQFASGTIAWAYVMGHIRLPLLLASTSMAWGAAIAAILTVDPLPKWQASSMLVVSTLALMLGLWGAHRDLSTLLSGTVMQFLGRISYSLFLIHLVIAARAMGVMDLWLPGTLAARWTMLIVGTALAVFTAWIMYRVLEKPSLELAQRVSLPRRPVTEASPGG